MMSPLEASATGRIFLAAALALVVVCVTAAFHYEALRALAGVWRGRSLSRATLVVVFVGLVGAHLAEVAMYGLVYAVGTYPLGLGSLEGTGHSGALGYFYFAAETYSTLGYGDVVPSGALRLIASVETVNGLLLISWSGAFLFCILCDQRGKPHFRL